VATILRSVLWLAGDLPYLVIIWVVFGVFLPGSNIVAAGLLLRYFVIWMFAQKHVLTFSAAIFFTSVGVYMVPFYLSNASVFVGIRGGTMGSLAEHWGMAAISGVIAMTGLIIARLLIAKLPQPKANKSAR